MERAILVGLAYIYRALQVLSLVVLLALFCFIPWLAAERAPVRMAMDRYQHAWATSPRLDQAGPNEYRSPRPRPA